MSDHESPAEEKRILDLVSAALTDQPDDALLRPLWPAVHEQLELSRRPVLRPVFGAAAAAALLAGIGLGLLVGSAGSRAPDPEAAYLWSTVGSSLVDDGESTLSGVWAGMSGEGQR